MPRILPLSQRNARRNFHPQYLYPVDADYSEHDSVKGTMP
jgi:hypothetical protein